MISRIQNRLKKYQHLWKEDNWTIYRLYRFVTSVKGQKKIFRLGAKIVMFVFRSILGIKKKEHGDYEVWMKKNMPQEKDLLIFRKDVEAWRNTPLVSVLIPVYNIDVNLFKETIASVKSQVYTNWELCIADDKSTNAELIAYLEELQEDPKIKVVFRAENGHISASSNSALELASGDYCALLDHDDVLTPDALYQNVKEIIEGGYDFLYSDEDKIDEEGDLGHPFFKPDWSPDTILSRNYICHFLVLKTSILKSIGGFRVGFEGAQDYDLILRFTEQTNKIKHLTKVLYHWRMHEGSTALSGSVKSYAFDAGQKALQEALVRRGEPGNVEVIDNERGVYSVRYEIAEKHKVSIIIPTKDKADVIGLCLESIFRLTDYENFEVIVLDNNSSEESFFSLMKEWEEKEPERFKVKRVEAPFNFSLLMNIGAKESEGEYLLLLNNDTEVLHADWITALVEQSQRNSIGVVGTRLIFPNDTIQHAGVIVGLGDVAAEHPFVGTTREDLGHYYNLKAVTNYSAVTAACFMVKKSIYNEVGGFDEKLQVEFNDVDFCLKVKEAGYNNVYLPHVELYHYESISRGHPMKTRASYKRHDREVNYFRSKWMKYIKKDPCYNIHLSRIFTYYELNVND